MRYDIFFLLCAPEDEDTDGYRNEAVGSKSANCLRKGGSFDNEVHQNSTANSRSTGGYEICINGRGFDLGKLELECLGEAIIHSKRVVCLLTQAFIRNDYCMFGFRAAWDHCLKQKKRRLVVIKWPDVDERLQLDQQSDNATLLTAGESEHTVTDVVTFLSTNPLINHDQSDWWDHLIYALPKNRWKPDEAQQSEQGR